MLRELKKFEQTGQQNRHLQQEYEFTNLYQQIFVKLDLQRRFDKVWLGVALFQANHGVIELIVDGIQANPNDDIGTRKHHLLRLREVQDAMASFYK